MHRSIGIAVVAVAAVAALWTWAVNHSVAQNKRALGIDTYALTAAAPAMQTQQFDAH